MALVLADRVQDTTTTTGTGTVTLSGSAPTGYQTFGTAIGNANTTYYTIAGGAEWEVGLGTYTAAGTTLSRDTVLASSAGGTTKVTFSAGTKAVFVTYPAEIALYTGGPLGTPASGTLTNATGLPISTGVSGLATGVATFLATPTSANLSTAITDETGSGALVFANTPTLVTPNIGAATGTSVNLSGAGTFGGNLTVTGNSSSTSSGTKTNALITTTANGSSYFYAGNSSDSSYAYLVTQGTTGNTGGTFPSGMSGVFSIGGAGAGFGSRDALPVIIYANITEVARFPSGGGLTLAAGTLTVAGPITLKSYTVATLPTPATGMMAYVTDAQAPVYNTTLVSGAPNIVVKAFYNGTNWVAG